jgi:hypothetical protein
MDLNKWKREKAVMIIPMMMFKLVMIIMGKRKRAMLVRRIWYSIKKMFDRGVRK